MIFPYFPKELLNIILEYDGRIKYKNGKYINILHKNDIRYNIIKPVITKKIKIIKKIYSNGSYFYFEFSFDIDNRIGLCYFYNYSCYKIWYYDTRKELI